MKEKDEAFFMYEDTIAAGGVAMKADIVADTFVLSLGTLYITIYIFWKVEFIYLFL